MGTALSCRIVALKSLLFVLALHLRRWIRPCISTPDTPGVSSCTTIRLLTTSLRRNFVPSVSCKERFGHRSSWHERSREGTGGSAHRPAIHHTLVEYSRSACTNLTHTYSRTKAADPSPWPAEDAETRVPRRLSPSPITHFAFQ